MEMKIIEKLMNFFGIDCGLNIHVKLLLWNGDKPPIFGWLRED
jgi:hypothetical protein